MTDPGWDYIDPEGQERSGYPSIAMWTWIKKGYFHPETKVGAYPEISFLSMGIL